MSTLSKLLAALCLGLLCFLAAAVAVAATLDSSVWPSLFVGLPVGGTVGLTAFLSTLATLRYRERRREGDLDTGVVAAYRAAVVAVAACVVVVPLGLAAVALDAGLLGTVLLVFGLPVCVAMGAAVVYVTIRRTGSPEWVPTL